MLQHLFQIFTNLPKMQELILPSTEVKTNQIAYPAPVIAIDGPSGSGKGTISLSVCNKLGWNYLDSGAIYRVLAYVAGNNNVELSDESALVRLAGELDIEFRDGVVWLSGEEIGDEIRTEEAGKRASIVAPLRSVREKLLLWQRSRAQQPGLVADGRDMGTVVFPHAQCKIFLTASAEARANRRFKQLRDKGFDVNIPRLFKEITERDARDANRAVSPLRPADDAYVLDTTDLDVVAAVSEVMRLVGVTVDLSN
jgi:cytidylate kinase